MEGSKNEMELSHHSQKVFAEKIKKRLSGPVKPSWTVSRKMLDKLPS